MANASGCDDGEIAYDNSSKMVLKRPHQWFVDGAEPELFPSKKQAVEGPSHHSFLGLLSSNNSHWGNGSGIHSAMGLFTECLLEPETARAINFDDNSTPSVGPCNTNMDRRIIEDSCGSNSSFGLSVSHTLEDPRSGLNCGGIRKVKVSQVKDSENFMSASVELAYNREDNSTMSTTHAYGKADENCISMGLSYNSVNGTIVSMDDAYNSADNNYISMGHNKEEDCTMLMGHPYKEPNIGISMGQSFRKDGDSIVKIGQTFNQDDDNNRSFGTSLQDSDITISMGQSFSKGDDSVLSMAQTFIRDDNNNTSINNSYSKLDQSGKVRNDIELMGQLFGKGESNIISFGGQDDDDISSSGRLMCNSDLFMGNFSSQRQLLSEKCLVESNVDAVAIVTKMTCSGSVSGSKSKEDQRGSKKVPPNNFPSNVRSLLSTGMLDGVPVKYNAWSREKELHGIIKGSGYLCGCQLCNFSKAINAYEFERHAGCKTKHPNNHIYFENGKTIYGIVQELRNTPQDLLFEVIQTITGSPINQKAFRLWRESFLAATCELQRIYGKDEGKQFA